MQDKQQFQQRLTHLNEEQRFAVETIDGPVLVVAGPGTGKTELLSMRVANILKETDTLPGSILCLTFTEAAARNMRERLAGLIGRAAYGVVINTFHGFGKDVRNEFRGDIYGGRTSEVADEVEKIHILSELFDRLPLRHPLRTKDPTGAWVHLGRIQTHITRLKQGGLRPEEYEQILHANYVFLDAAAPLLQEFAAKRASKQVLESISELCHELAMIEIPDVPHFGFQTLQEVFIAELTSIETTKMLSAWKQKNIVKDSDNLPIHKMQKNREQLEGAATLYQWYQQTMYERGRFDFDDMLLDTVYALEQHAELRYTLQERFQYVLVDEFQDTSGVQMRFLNTLLNMEITEGNPNIMAVGDDDQAIYKFQGANLSNLLNFTKQFAAPQFVTLTKNYRSHQNILDLAQCIMEQAEDRLGKDEEGYVAKQLYASHPERTGEGVIGYEQFQTPLHEFEAIATKMRAYHEQGIAYREMAVIAPKHKYLVDIAAYLHERQLPIAYAKKNNVLEDEVIIQLSTMLELIASLEPVNASVREELLPTILAYEFWGISTQSLWKFAVHCRKERGSWWDLMDTYTSFAPIKHFFAELGRMQANMSVERMIDYLLGSQTVVYSGEPYQIPLYSYYFSEEARTRDPEAYLQTLSRIHTFLGFLRETQKDDVLTVRDALAVLAVMQAHRKPITDHGIFQSGTDAIQLCSAHGAKGLEFEVVFVMAATQDAWAGKGNMQDLAFPPNLPLAPDTETMNDKLRLFYVALTRAKKYLHITASTYGATGKELEALQFLVTAEQQPEEKKDEITQDITLLEHHLGIRPISLPSPLTMEELLRPILDTYVMSVTHLNDYVDIAYKGPRYFLEQHLLRFPRSKNISGSFGTAMHAAIQEFHKILRVQGTTPEAQVLYDAFTEALRREYIPQEDFLRYHEQGLQELEVYYQERAHALHPDDLLERDFREQGVVIDGVAITGKVDKLRIRTKERRIEVTDFKTGKADPLIKPGYKADGIQKKLWAYKNQLVFYKLLVEHSKTYAEYRVDEGFLEFLEHTKKGDIAVMPFTLTDEDVEELRWLLLGVAGRIQRMEFTQETNPEATFKDVLAFAEELREEARAQFGH